MVVASPTPTCTVPVHAQDFPLIDFSWSRDRVSELVLRACQEFGFFRVVNHGVPEEIVAKIESLAINFFSLPAAEKHCSGPPTPLGYGSRNIGFSGDVGELEYLILPTNPTSMCQRAQTICRKDPVGFSSVVNEYVRAMRELASEILDMLAEQLGLSDSRAFSKLITDFDSDSLIRLNHYPPRLTAGGVRVGFGEHSDPQLLSILRSNVVDGLQILNGDAWVPVPSQPADAFCVSVGDMLQASTNGRLVSVRHRAMTSCCKARLSMVYFGGPPLQTRISPLAETITPEAPRKYKAFTWAEYKKAMYSLRLGYNRLDLYKADEEGERAEGFAFDLVNIEG